MLDSAYNMFQCFFYIFSDLMNSPALCLNKVERVGRIVEILKNETFCGFPVVNAKGRVGNLMTFNETLNVKKVYLEIPVYIQKH